MSGKRLPEWLRKKGISNRQMAETKRILNKLQLKTVCRSAKCPNIGECFAARTATFMIMGEICTRDCRFCAVKKGQPLPLDQSEPSRLAQAVKEMGLKHVVITSVTRDDLRDGGAIQFVRVIEEVRALNRSIIIEILTPDFKGDIRPINQLVQAGPTIFNHNIETVPRLYATVRPQADYQRSLQVLATVKKSDSEIYTKSGLMVGLGEREAEVLEVMRELRVINCDILTIGQYLQPGREHLPVVKYIEPEQFERYQELGRELGFKYISAGPYVRSSFHAADFSEQYL